MIHILKKCLAFIVLFMVVVFGMTHGIARGEDIALANLPEIIRNAGDKAIPNTKWNKAVKNSDGKHTWYELGGVDAKGRKVCVTVEPNGDIEEIETEIKAQNTPKVVLAALKGKFPNFKITAVYEIRDDQDKIIRYDIDGKRLNDKEEITISFSGDGKFIKIDD